MNESHRAKGIVLAVLGVLVLIPDALLVRLIATNPATLLFWRGLLMGLSMFAFLIFFRKIKPATIRKDFSFYLLSGLLLSGATCFFVLSITATKVANTLFILSTTPIIAALLTKIVYSDKISRNTWITMIFCFSGVGIMTIKDVETTAFLGNLAALGAACFHAGNFTLLRKAKNADIMLAVALSGGIVAVVSFFFATPFSIPGPDIVYMGILGIIILPVSFGLLTYAPQFVSPVDVSLIMLLETVLSPLLVWIVLGESMTVYGITGGVIVLLSLLAYIIYRRF
ncbi:MAG: DMT family transporter [Sinomicrobium sp.]|nr:DMT family transporter [Sinomicrobium sp.]